MRCINGIRHKEREIARSLGLPEESTDPVPQPVVLRAGKLVPARRAQLDKDFSAKLAGKP